MTDVHDREEQQRVTEPIEPLDPRAARSREKMLRAATDLLVESGPRGVTVDAVAEASGVAKSTLYRHWSSRNDMLIEVVTCNVPQIEDPDLGSSFEAVLRSHLAQIAATLADPEWSRIIPALMSLRVSMPELAEFVESDRAAKTEVLEAIVDLGVNEGVLPVGLDVEALDKLLFGPLVFASIIGDHEQLERLADVIADHFLAAFAQR